MKHLLTTQSAQKEPSKQFASLYPLQQTLSDRSAMHPLLRLQRAVGNQAVQRMVSEGGAGLQTQLRVNLYGPGAQALASTISSFVLQRKCSCGGIAESPESVEECAECKSEATLQHRAMNQSVSPATNAIPQIVHDVLSSQGQPLDAGTRAFMEPRFKYDFSKVRVHTDTKSAASAQSVNALAYTAGQDVVFGARQYAPKTNKGRELLAHELTHVVQQAAGLPSKTHGLDGGPADLYEQEAHLHAKRVVSEVDPLSSSLKILSHTGYPIIQRYPVPGSLDCGDVVDWLNVNSPYAPEWAQTSCTYSFNGQLRISRPQPSDAGGVQLTVKGHNGLTVSVDCPIDRPQWTPSARPNRSAEVTAWRSMRAALDAHEQQHKRIGQQWRTILQEHFRATNFTVEGSDKADAMDQVRQKIADDQQQWQADAQQAQDAIDPFQGAQLNCP